MNHESIHIVMGDNANSIRPALSLDFFRQGCAHRRRSGSQFSTVPSLVRGIMPTRWFREGIAGDIHGDVEGAAGSGRAMGGWDENGAFRAMVRDDDYIYDAVGLESEGTAADFQTGASLVSVRHAIHDVAVLYKFGPDKLVEWVSSRRKHAALFRSCALHRCTEWGWTSAWKLWIADERRFQEGESGATSANIRSPSRST